MIGRRMPLIHVAKRAHAHETLVTRKFHVKAVIYQIDSRTN